MSCDNTSNAGDMQNAPQKIKTIIEIELAAGCRSDKAFSTQLVRPVFLELI